MATVVGSGGLLVQACLTKDPKARPSAQQLLQHDWLVGQVEAEGKGVPEVGCAADWQML